MQDFGSFAYQPCLILLTTEVAITLTVVTTIVIFVFVLFMMVINSYC